MVHRVINSIRYRLSNDAWHRAAIENFGRNYRNKKISVKELNLEIKYGEFSFLVNGYKIFRNLIAEGAGYFFAGDKVIMQFDDLKFIVKTVEDLFILKEIFVDRTYCFKSKEPYAVIDIGMNIGIASLFFASNPLVEKVFSFEPFSETYQEAIGNLELNQLYRTKIITYNLGLGKAKSSIKTKYSREFAGRMGVDSDIWQKFPTTEYTETEIQMMDAGSTVTELVNSNEYDRWVIKLDCEGTEKEIIESLSQAKVFEKINAIMIEVHNRKDITPISYCLNLNQFDHFIINSQSRNSIIYGIRR